MFCIWNFNNLTGIFLARITEHLSICRRSIPSLRRNGGSFSELTVPRFAIPTPFHISCVHMSYRHNLYHLTHVATKHVVQMRHFQNVQWRFTRNPFPRENLPMKFGSCRSSHMIFLQCVSLTHSSNSQTVNHYLIIQSNWSFHNQAMTLAIKFNKNLWFYLLHKLTCSIVGFL